MKPEIARGTWISSDVPAVVFGELFKKPGAYGPCRKDGVPAIAFTSARTERLAFTKTVATRSASRRLNPAGAAGAPCALVVGPKASVSMALAKHNYWIVFSSTSASAMILQLYLAAKPRMPHPIQRSAVAPRRL